MIPVEKAGAYGMIVQHRILHALPLAEHEEFDRLDRRKHRTPIQDRRIDELWALALVLHGQQQEAEDAQIAANLEAEIKAAKRTGDTQYLEYLRSLAVEP